MKRVAVLHAQVPFQWGGAEALVEGLVKAINRELLGVRAELVQLPFKWYPEEQILADIMAWRLLDLSQSCGEPIDLVIGTKFPSYAVKHAKKVLWLVHQHRVLYDLEGGEYDRLILSAQDLAIRNKIREVDAMLIGESKGIYTISHTVSERLLRFNRIASKPLAPPSPLADKINPGAYGDYIVCIARINRLKRQHLLVEALVHCSRAKAIIIGHGDDVYRAELEERIKSLQLQQRCQLVGFAEEKVLLNYLSGARAVFYAPHDEDYGYAAVEGFLAQKPLITCADSGEVRRFVEVTQSGWVAESDPLSISNVLEKVMLMPDKDLHRVASAGYAMAKTVNWKNVLEEIVVPFL